MNILTSRAGVPPSLCAGWGAEVVSIVSTVESAFTPSRQFCQAWMAMAKRRISFCSTWTQGREYDGFPSRMCAGTVS